MTKFLMRYVTVCAVFLLLPPACSAVVAFAVFSVPMAPNRGIGFALVAACENFGNTISFLAVTAFYPGLIVLAGGLIVCFFSKPDPSVRHP